MQDIEEVVEESEETAAPEEVKEPDYRGFANSAEGLSLYKTVIAVALFVYLAFSHSSLVPVQMAAGIALLLSGLLLLVNLARMGECSGKFTVAFAVSVGTIFFLLVVNNKSLSDYRFLLDLVIAYFLYDGMEDICEQAKEEELTLAWRRQFFLALGLVLTPEIIQFLLDGFFPGINLSLITGILAGIGSWAAWILCIRLLNRTAKTIKFHHCSEYADEAEQTDELEDVEENGESV